MGRRPSAVPKPACPQHPGGYVVFDGLYGKRGHKRQRYRCYPTGSSGAGRSFHRFVEPLPRQMAVGGFCVVCERDVHPHEGHQGPRNYVFCARDVAEALVEVGGGATYSAAASRARRRAGRFPKDRHGRDHYTRHGQLVADWVEVFAPVVFEPHRRVDWPERNTVVLDHLGFRSSGWDQHGRPKTGPVAFNVFAAQGYEHDRGHLWQLGAYRDASAKSWSHFVGQLGGAPDRFVTDGHTGTIAAARRAWPRAEHWRALWQLQDAMKDYLVRAQLHGNTRINRALSQAFSSPFFWEHFTVIAYRHRKQVPKLWGWIERYGALVEEQLWRRPRPSVRRSNPTTMGGLEIKLEYLKAWITPRVHGFRNRERLNRLLLLMQLQINDQADVDAYTRSIRDWLLARDGQPGPRRMVADTYGTSSLISPAAQRFRRVPGSP